MVQTWPLPARPVSGANRVPHRWPFRPAVVAYQVHIKGLYILLQVWLGSRGGPPRRYAFRACIDFGLSGLLSPFWGNRRSRWRTFVIRCRGSLRPGELRLVTECSGLRIRPLGLDRKRHRWQITGFKAVAIDNLRSWW